MKIWTNRFWGNDEQGKDITRILLEPDAFMGKESEPTLQETCRKVLITQHMGASGSPAG